jgi:putative addiction module antidote
MTPVITAVDITMTALKLTQIGNSVGVILPKELLARLKLEKGDTVYVTDATDGIKLTPYSAEFEAQMSVARRLMKQRRNALRELAK